MKDKDFNLLGLAAIVLIIWYLLASKSRAAPATPAQAAQDSGALPVSWDAPMTGVYDANPAAYQPASAQSLTVNIANQSASLLSDRYIPMFGFVGMAQGAMYNA